jgi:hypothetical protein
MNDAFLAIPKTWRFVDTDPAKSAIIYEAVDGEHTDRILVTHRRRAVMYISAVRAAMQADADANRPRFVDPSVALVKIYGNVGGVAGFGWAAEDSTYVSGTFAAWPFVFRCLMTSGRSTLELTAPVHDTRGSTMRQAAEMLQEWH